MLMKDIPLWAPVMTQSSAPRARRSTWSPGDLILLHKRVWAGEVVPFSPRPQALLGDAVVGRAAGELKDLPSP